MKDSETLLIFSLVISALAPALGMLIWNMKQNPKLTNLLIDLLKEANHQNRSLTHLIVSRDISTYASLQSLSQMSPQSSQTTPSPNSTYSNSDYIPRDDATEAMRIKAFGGAVGYGEVNFPEDDEDLAEALSELVANGQVDLGEGVIN